MSPAEAARILEVAPDATADQLEVRFLELRRKLEDKIAKAPTPGLQAKYRESLAQITTAFETLTLAADSSALPVLSKQSALSSQPAGGTTSLRAEPSVTPPPAIRPPSSSKKSGSGREFIVVAIIAAAVLAAGGWWVTKTRSENSEKVRVAAELAERLAKEAEAKVAEEKRRTEAAQLAAETKRQAEEAKRQADEVEKARIAVAQKAEQERLDKLLAHTGAELAHLRIGWDAVEQEARKAERQLSELRNDERTLTNGLKGAAPGTDLLRLRAKIAAQASYQEWLESQLSRHEAKVLRAQTEAMISARQIDEAARIAAQAAAAQAAFDQDIAATRARMLALTGSIKIDVHPAEAEWSITDIYGTKHTGRGSSEAPDIPWGPVVFETNLPGFQSRKKEAVLRRDESLVLSFDFKPPVLRVDSSPAGAEITLNGKAHGTTPATLTWPAEGEVELGLKLRGHKKTSQKLKLVSGSELDVGTVSLPPVDGRLTRPDLDQGPLRYAVAFRHAFQLQSAYNSDPMGNPSHHAYEQEYTVTVHTATGSPVDATKVTVVSQRYANEKGMLFYPGTVREYTKQADGWYNTLKAGGSPDPQLQAVLKKRTRERSPVARRTGMEAPEWWPSEGKEPGDTWQVPLAALNESGFAHLEAGEQQGSITGRLLDYRIDGDRHIAEVEFTFDASSSSTSDGTKRHSRYVGRAICTLDLTARFVTALNTTMEHTTITDIPVSDGTRLKSTNLSSAKTTYSIRPL